MLHRQNSTLWEKSARLFICANCHNWNMRLEFKHVECLSVTEEEMHTAFQLVLEDKVLVVVADLNDIAAN